MKAATRTSPVAVQKPRSCRDFIDQWTAHLRQIEPDAELDFSFRDDAVTITDMSIPSKLRVGILYKRHEVEDNLDAIKGDFDNRVERFLRGSFGPR